MYRTARLAARSLIGLLTASGLLVGVALPAAAAPVEGWQPPLRLDPTPNALSTYLELSVNATGAALAMWYEWNTTLGYPWANTYTPAAGWGTPTLLSHNGQPSLAPPSVSLGDDGTGIAAWTEGESANRTVHVARHSPAGGWDPPTTLSALGSVSLPRAQATNAGGGFVFWAAGTPGGARAMAAQYVGGSGWLAPADVFPVVDGTNAWVVQSGATANGTVVALVGTADANDTNLSVRSFAPGLGWQAPEAIEANASVVPAFWALSVARNGGVLVAWSETDLATFFRTNARGFSPSGGWEPTRVIANDTGLQSELVAGVDGAGNASALWVYYDGAVRSVAASHYTRASGWSAPRELDLSDYQSADNLLLAVAESGVATALWGQLHPSGATFAYSRLGSDGSWAASAPVPTAYSSIYIALGCDAAGAPMAAFNDGYELHSIAYVAREFEPPALVVATPPAGAALNGSAVAVTGTTEAGATVVANGVTADVAADGSFRAVVALLPGTNTIRVTATDEWGNEASSSLTVTSTDPAAEFEAALAAAEANASAARAAADAAQAEASVAASAAAAAQARAASLETELNTTTQALAQAQADAAATNATAADLLARVTALEEAAGQNGAAALQADRRAAEAQTAASGSLTVALAAAVIGAAGAGVGALALVQSRRKPPTGGAP